MAKLLDKQRYKCALGAMQTVQAIERAIPILHSGPGCAQKLSDGNGSSGGGGSRAKGILIAAAVVLPTTGYFPHASMFSLSSRKAILTFLLIWTGKVMALLIVDFTSVTVMI